MSAGRRMHRVAVAAALTASLVATSAVVVAAAPDPPPGHGTDQDTDQDTGHDTGHDTDQEGASPSLPVPEVLTEDVVGQDGASPSLPVPEVLTEDVVVEDGNETVVGQYLVSFASEPARRRGLPAIEAAGWSILYDSEDDGTQPWTLVEVGDWSLAEQAVEVAELRAMRDVVRVNPNHVRRLIQTTPPWNLDRIDQRSLPLSGPYRPGSTGRGVRVYVVDDGIRREHADFGGRVTAGAWSGSFTSDSHPTCSTHGSHVAGTVGGTVSGVAKQVELIPVRVFGCDGSASDAAVLAALDWILGDHARRGGGTAIVNLSFGGSPSGTLDAKVAQLDRAGLLVVTAAGNDGVNACNVSPARASASLTVAASNSVDVRPGFSNFGSCVDLFAPGVSIRSVDSSNGRTSGFVSWNGTSMAAPHAAGAAALLLERQPGMSPAQVRQRLISDATTGVISNPGSGTPNRLLFVGSSGPPPSPEPVPGRPANDDFASSATLRPDARSVTGSNVGATQEAGEPRHAGVPGGASVWWRFTPDRDGQVTLTTQGSSFDTVLAVYTGSALSNLREVASNDDAPGLGLQSRVSFRATAGTPYRIAVDGYGGAQGSIRLNLEIAGRSALVPIAPARLVDSRLGQGARGPVTPGETVVVRVAGRAGVPSDASAVALNVTAVDARGSGFVSVTPCTAGGSVPTTSSLNYVPGQTVANAVITAIGRDGSICVYTSAAIDLLVDVVGALESGFDAVPPSRLLDTRSGPAAAAGSVTRVRVAGRAGVPNNAAAAVLNVTAVAPVGAGYLTVYSCDGPPPVASNVNYGPGAVVPNAVVARMNAAGEVCVFTSATTHLLVDVAGALDPSFNALPPQRLLETRNGRPPAAGSITIVDVAGRGGVPRDAGAVVLNVTAVDPLGPGFVSVFPCGAEWRSFQPSTSSLNYVTGRNVANVVVSPLGTAGGTRDGAVCLYTSATAHLLVDVAGAFR